MVTVKNQKKTANDLKDNWIYFLQGRPEVQHLQAPETEVKVNKVSNMKISRMKMKRDLNAVFNSP